MNSTDPWHLTVVRTRGLLLFRPEKSWRPIVSINVVNSKHDHGISHEVVLGCDGQNPNLKTVLPVHDVTLATRLVVQVFHRGQTKKKNRKRSLVGSASISLAEFLHKHPLPHHRPVDFDVRLSCTPPLRKSAALGGRQHNATLTMRFVVPHDGSETRVYESDSGAESDSDPMSDHHTTDGMMSDGASSSRSLLEAPDASQINGPWGKQPEQDVLDGTSTLRRRRKARRETVRGFHINTDSEAHHSGWSSDGESSSAPEPATPTDSTPPPRYAEADDSKCGPGFVCAGDEVGVASPSMLPLYMDQVSMVSGASLSMAWTCFDSLSPYYNELHESEEQGDIDRAEKAFRNLIMEWYVVGGSLLALAAIDAAVFGFAPEGLFVIDGLSREAVAVGAIAAGIGLVCDCWFLVLYSGAPVQKFQRLAKDVYGSYFFFSLTCRLPTLCMSISALALMAFLLAVAWTAWPTAVLVMSFVAGFLLTSQFLVFGIHRAVNFFIWLIRVAWRAVARKAAPAPHVHVIPPSPPQQSPYPQPHPRRSAEGPRKGSETGLDHPRPSGDLALPQGELSTNTSTSTMGEARMEMPLPCPSPAHVIPQMEMKMVWAEEHRA